MHVAYTWSISVTELSLVFLSSSSTGGPRSLRMGGVADLQNVPLPHVIVLNFGRSKSSTDNKY